MLPVRGLHPTWPTVLLGISTFVAQYAASGICEAPLLGQHIGHVPSLDVLLCSTAVLQWLLFDCSPQGIDCCTGSTHSGTCIAHTDAFCTFHCCIVQRFAYCMVLWESLAAHRKPSSSALLSDSTPWHMHLDTRTLAHAILHMPLLHMLPFGLWPQRPPMSSMEKHLGTVVGFAMAGLTAVAGPIIEIGLIKQLGLYHYTHAGSLGIPSWIPWVYFCGSPAVGNLGRKVRMELLQQQSAVKL